LEWYGRSVTLLAPLEASAAWIPGCAGGSGPPSPSCRMEEPERGKPLQLTLKGLRSWRTGDFRIVYRIVEQTIEILVVAVGHRREVYDRLRERV
jgi:hypothetical protein